MFAARRYSMTYVEQVLEDLKKRNPNEPEFHQAATEILTTLAPVVEAHPEYEKAGLLERFVEPERVVPGWTTAARRVSTRVIAFSSTAQSVPTRAVSGFILL